MSDTNFSDLEQYKLDEKQPLLNYTMTKQDDDWATNFLQRIKDDIDNPEVQAFKRLAQEIGKVGGKCLDVGCAMGQQYDCMQMYCPSVGYTGVDVYQTYIDKNKTRLPGVDFRKITDYYALPFADGEFDVVTIRSLIEYYFPENGMKILNDAYRVAKKALIVKTRIYPQDLFKDIVVHTFRGGKGPGYKIRWTQADWNKFFEGKNVEIIKVESAEIYLIRK